MVSRGEGGVSPEGRIRELEANFLDGPYNSGSLSESAAFRYLTDIWFTKVYFIYFCQGYNIFWIVSKFATPPVGILPCFCELFCVCYSANSSLFFIIDSMGGGRIYTPVFSKVF